MRIQRADIAQNLLTPTGRIQRFHKYTLRVVFHEFESYKIFEISQTQVASQQFHYIQKSQRL